MYFSRIIFNVSKLTIHYFSSQIGVNTILWKSILNRSFSTDYLSMKHPRITNYVESLVKEYRELTENNETGKFSQRLQDLKPIFDLYEQKLNFLECVSSLKELCSGDSKDDDLKKQIEKETLEYLQNIEQLDQQLLNQLVPQDIHDIHNKIIMEIIAGVGGQEAMLFAKELCDMYCSYIYFKGWVLDNCHCEESEIGGVRHATLFVTGDCAYKYLKYEAGVHRVQRVPATEKSGRLHTSTVSITVLPQPKEVDVQILDKDLKIETKRASGAGGQHVNTTESAVRINHIPSGISVECQTDRSQIKNRQEAMRKLRAILFKKQIDDQFTATSFARKTQVKSNERSEKIRTYNFSQDRITDHRISGNFHNLSNFLTGSELLDTLIEKLDEHRNQEILLQKIEESCSKG